ncbi:MAG: hypothetical protein QM704_28045 [Anaeromyxobacteraceae bacterium]
MTAPRQVLPGTTHFITHRCLERRFYFKPTPEVRQVFGFLLAVMAERHGILLHVACVLSNHYHLVLTDPKGELPAFMQEFNSTLARFLNKLWGRSENVFPSGGYQSVDLMDAAAVTGHGAYALANPAAAKLIPRSKRWPGLWSAPEAIGRKGMVFERPPIFFRRAGPLPDRATLTFTVPPGQEPADFRRALEKGIREHERVAIEAVRKSGEKFLGLKAVLAQEPGDRATGEEKPRQSMQRAASTDGKLWHDALVRLRVFRQEYAAALALFLGGLRTTAFPAGTYKLRVQLGFQCAPAG